MSTMHPCGPSCVVVCSRAGEITNILYKVCGDRIKDILPALGSHDPMESPALEKFFGAEIPKELFRVHDWRNDVVQIGTVPAAFVSQALPYRLGVCRSVPMRTR